MTFPSLIGIQTTYKFLLAGHGNRLVRHMQLLISYTHHLLSSVCHRRKPPRGVLRLNLGTPESPIIPVFTSQPRSLAAHCQARGFMVRPIVAPTVPLGSERVRICLHAGNSEAEVEGLCRAVEMWVMEQMGLSHEPRPVRKQDNEDGGEGNGPKSRL
jgi:8-amino-7-oxononanoate synthase